MYSEGTGNVGIDNVRIGNVGIGNVGTGNAGTGNVGTGRGLFLQYNPTIAGLYCKFVYWCLKIRVINH